MICEIEFVKQAVKFGKGVNELSVCECANV